jgi:hypothetical protein
MAEDHEARLTILDRAQILYDATLRRHGDMLDTHAETITLLRGIQERQERLLETLTTIAAQHTERMTTLQQTLDAIKDLLDRGNER